MEKMKYIIVFTLFTLAKSVFAQFSNESTPEFITQVRSVATGLCIEIPDDGDSNDGGDNADSRNCVDDESRQRIHFITVGAVSNIYSLRIEHSGLCLTVPDNGTANGVSLIQSICNGGSSQQFRVEDNGTYNFIFTGTGAADKVVDSHADTADIIQWEFHGGVNQRWILDNPDDPFADASSPLSNPIPETITTSGLVVKLQEFTTIEASSEDGPRARINFLDHANEDRDRLFVNDMRGKLHAIENNNVSTYLDVNQYFSDFVTGPQLSMGFGFFTFHPEFNNNGKMYTAHSEGGDALLTKTADYTSICLLYTSPSPRDS